MEKSEQHNHKFTYPGFIKFAVPAAILLVAAVFAMAGSTALAGPKCEPVNGHIIAKVVPVTDCSSPFGLCTNGTMIGGIQGNFNFAVTSFNLSLDPSIPLVALYTGRIAIKTKDGNFLNGTEAGAFDIDPAGNGDFSELLMITGGTGDMDGASGHIAISGYVNLGTGVGASDYKGEICTP